MAEERLFPRWLVAAVGILLVGLTLWALRTVLIPVFLGFIIAYLLDPIVDRFEERNLPRSLGISVMLALLIVVMTLLGIIAVPIIAADVAQFIDEVPQLTERLRLWLEPFLAQFGVALPHSLSEAMTQVDRDQLAGAVTPAGNVLRWLAGGTVSLVAAVAWLLMIPVFAAYLLHDFDYITAGIRDLIPERWRPYVVDVAKEVDEVLGEFIRGQLLVMGILAVAYVLCFWALGIRMALLIGIVGGLLSFIPYVGNAFALTMAVVMCLIDWTGWPKLIGVVVAYSIIQTVEGFVITPRVVGDKVGLPAVWVLFALLVGGELFGFLGVLLALPAAAVVKIFVIRFLGWYRQTEFFRSSDPQAAVSRVWPRILTSEGLPDDKHTRAAKRAALGADDDGPDDDAGESVVEREAADAPPSEAGLGQPDRERGEADAIKSQ